MSGHRISATRPAPVFVHSGAVAFAASIAVHLTVLVTYAVLYTEPPHLMSAHTIEVEITSGAEQAAPSPITTVPRPVPNKLSPQPAQVAVSDEPTVAPMMSAATESTTSPAAAATSSENAGDTAFTETRYDVAVLNNPKPSYPYVARRSGIEGRVVVTAKVRTDGRCDEVRLKQSSGHDALDTAALDTVRKWRFLPARRAGQAVEAWVEVPIVFKLQG